MIAALLHPFPLTLIALGTAALIYCVRAERAAERRRETEGRRALHPATRDVMKRTVHIAPDWKDMWADFYRSEHVS